MRKAILLILLSLLWTTGFSQHLSFEFGTPFRRTDLDVRWKVTTNGLPREAWVYRLLPRQLSPSLVSNLAALGRFSSKDLIRSNADEMLFRRPDYSSFGISFRLGAIEYYPRHQYGPTNLAQHVPKMTELPELTTNFLREVGIRVEDIEKRPDGSPDFHFSEPFTVYFANHTFITNIAFRAVGFRRAVDGAQFVGAGAGGDCHVEFGEYGKPSKISLSWRKLERHKACPTASPETILSWIRQGKAVQNMVLMGTEPVDWKTAKSVTVTKAELCYYAGSPFQPSDWLMPFAALWTTVDTGHGKVQLEIDCPVIAESNTK